jgi:hypothetical protein
MEKTAMATTINKQCHTGWSPVVSRVSWRNDLTQPKDTQRRPSIGLATSAAPGSLTTSVPDAPAYLDEESAETIVRIEVDNYGFLPSHKRTLMLFGIIPGLFFVSPYGVSAFMVSLPFLLWARWVKRTIRARALDVDSDLKKKSLKRTQSLLYWHIFRFEDVARVKELRKTQGLSLKEAMVIMLKEYLMKEFPVHYRQSYPQDQESPAALALKQDLPDPTQSGQPL